MTEKDFVLWLNTALPGARCVYHEGMTLRHDKRGKFLPGEIKNHAPPAAPAAIAAYGAHQSGLVTLYEQIGEIISDDSDPNKRLRWRSYIAERLPNAGRKAA